MTRFLRAALAVVMFCAVPAAAQVTDVAIWGSWGQFDAQEFADPDFDAELEFDDGTGFGASVNWFWTDRFSTELFAMAMETDAVFRVGFGDFEREDVPLGSINLTPIMVTGQYHFAPSGRIDPYLGAGLAYVVADDLDAVVTEDFELEQIEIDDEFTFLLNAGVGFTFTPRVGMNLDLRYLPLEPASRAAGDPEEVDLEMNPLIVSVGLRYRFGF